MMVQFSTMHDWARRGGRRAAAGAGNEHKPLPDLSQAPSDLRYDRYQACGAS